VLLDPSTVESLVRGLSGNSDAARMATAGVPELPETVSATTMTLEREEILHSFGLTERDLDFMGDEQRTKVEEVIHHVMAAHAFA